MALYFAGFYGQEFPEEPGGRATPAARTAGYIAPHQEAAALEVKFHLLEIIEAPNDFRPLRF